MRGARLTKYAAATAFAFALMAGAQSASAQTFRVLSVDTLGCASGQFGMTVERAGLDGGAYTVRTVVNGGGLTYMNESASVSINGTSGWNLFDNFTYGPVSNPGTWPIPAGTPLRIDFTLERPVGTVLYAWTLAVDGCNTGAITYNGLTSAYSSSVAAVPTLSLASLLGLSGALLGLGALARRRRQ